MSSGDTWYHASPLSRFAAATRDVRCHGFASLTLLVWDYFVTLDDEVQYIWVMRNKSPFKWVYLFLRYVVIFTHATHNFLIEQLANGTNPHVLCSMWPIYVLGLSQTLETLLELVLASRVFALYNRSKKVAFLLIILILSETAGSLRILYSQHNPRFHGVCLLIQGSTDHRYQSVLAFTVHCTLIGLTWTKYFLALRAGWGRTPLVSLVVRDSSTVYLTIIFMLTAVTITCGLQDERGVAVIFWCTTVFSVSGCRMILSMENFARKERSSGAPHPGQLFFTSEIYMGVDDFGRTLGSLSHHSNIAPPLTLQTNGNVS